jgi:AAHS family 3-hydroxyphenylpropionic acid transporter
MNATTAVPDIPGARLTLWLCFAVAVLEGYDLQVLSVAGPLLREAMQLNPRQLGFAFSASLIGLALGAAYGGTIADRVGRKKVLLVSVIGLGIMTVATALARDFQTLLIMRVLAGVAMGGAMPNIIAISASVSGKGRTTSAVSAMICGMPAGGVIAALAGHALVASFGWRGMFVLGGVMTLLIVPFLVKGLAESKPGERRAAAPVSVRQSLFGEGRAPTTLLLWALFILTLAILSLFTGWAATLVVDKGLPATAGFSAMMAINIGGIAGALVSAAWCDRWQVRGAMLVMYVGMAVSLWLFSASDVASAVIPMAGVVGFFVLGAQCALYGISPQLYPPANYATGVGSAVGAGRIGSIIGPIVAGQVMSRGAAANEVVMGMVPVAVTAGVVLLALAAVSGGALTKHATKR